MATALLTGLVSDTDNFSNGATSSEALSIASELIRAGGNLNLINGWTLKTKRRTFCVFGAPRFPALPAMKVWIWLTPI